MEGKIRLIAITTTYYVSVAPIIDMISFIKSITKDVKIVIGGPFVSSQKRLMKEKELNFLFKLMNADYFIESSTGDKSLIDLIDCLKNGKDINEVKNLYYAKDGNYFFTEKSDDFINLDNQTINWTLFRGRTSEYIDIRTSISCPFRCSFCGFPEHAGEYHTSLVSTVENELNNIVSNTDAKVIQFIDDTLNIPESRFVEILKMMIKNKYDLKWYAHYRCQFANAEIIELMKESGCIGVFLGIESGNNEILKNMNKKSSVEKYYKGVELLKRYDITVHGSFIIGFPGETESTVKDTVDFIKNSGIDYYRAQLWYCDMMTPIWKLKDEYGIKGSCFEWSHNTMDSKKACELIKKIFLENNDPVWVPQYNFESGGVFHLLQMGYGSDEVKNIIEEFNNAVRFKFKSNEKNISEEMKDKINGMINNSERAGIK
jgi:radical SAM PhpK family P-methyltransferase